MKKHGRRAISTCGLRKTCPWVIGSNGYLEIDLVVVKRANIHRFLICGMTNL
jgi:hypothetical protein